MALNLAKLSKVIRVGKLVKRYKVSRRFNESPDTFKSIEVGNWRKMTTFCPFCEGENVDYSANFKRNHQTFTTEP